MLKTHVLLLSKQFLAGHPKAGQPTCFFDKISCLDKIHTIRSNYEFWKKRIDQVNEGKAILSIRQWTGKPYKSPQQELLQLYKAGIQKLEWDWLGWFIDDYDSDFGIKDFAPNDGLSVEDFKAWFKKYPVEPMAIIHFTDFKYHH